MIYLQIHKYIYYYKNLAKWYFKNGEDADALTILQKYIELTGMAEFLTHTTEITRLSMILGDSKDVRDYGERPKDSV